MRIGILTVSDKGAKGEREDRSGPAIRAIMEAAGAQVARYRIVPDEQDDIKAALTAWSDEGLDLILTTGGTGFSPRDWTPEATRAVIEREAPGISEAIRRAGMEKTPTAMLSRKVAFSSSRKKNARCWIDKVRSRRSATEASMASKSVSEPSSNTYTSPC